jgi:ATP synthase H subunit
VRDVIQKIVATENQAKRIVEDGRTQADRILLEARKKAQDITAKAYQEAGREAQEIIAEAAREAEVERQKTLSEALDRLEREVIIDEKSRQNIIDEIVRHVCGTSQGKEI